MTLNGRKAPLGRNFRIDIAFFYLYNK